MGEISNFQCATASITGPLGTVMLLIAAGMVALAVEIFIIPGFGAVGLIGIGALIAGMVSAWLEFGAFWGMVTIAATLAGASAMIIFLFRTKAVKRRLILDTHLDPGGGTQSGDSTTLLEKTGIAVTSLRPAGIAIIGDIRVDVVSEGGYIEQDTEIKVVAIEGPRIIVGRMT